MGISKYSGGPIVQTDGAGLSISGLKRLLMLFDAKERLSALQMTLNAGGIGKPGFDRVLAHLKEQYPVKSIENPSIGNKFAVFETKGARIELDGPHMSFDISATYMTKEFYKAMAQIDEEESRSNEKNEKSQF